MSRSREELVEAAREEAQRRTLGVEVTSLLTEFADLLDSLEEREEWRVNADLITRAETRGTREQAERLREQVGAPAARIQHRTVTESAWTDVEEGTDG